ACWWCSGCPRPSALCCWSARCRRSAASRCTTLTTASAATSRSAGDVGIRSRLSNRTDIGRRARENDRVLQLTLVGLQFFGRRGIDDDHIADHFPLGAGGPTGRGGSDGSAILGLEQLEAERSSFPAHRNRPRFQVDILQAITLHLFGGVFVGALQV